MRGIKSDILIGMTRAGETLERRLGQLAAQRVEAELRRVWARGRRGEDPMQEGQSE